MMHRCSSPDRTNLQGVPSAFHVFTSGYVNPEGSARKKKKKKTTKQRRRKQKNQCLLVLTNKFEATFKKIIILII